MAESFRRVSESPSDAIGARQALQYAVSCAVGSDEVVRPDARLSHRDFEALARSELRSLLDQVLLARFADLGLEALRVTGALEILLPEVSALVGFGDYEWRHKDVWRHTKQVVIQAKPRVAVRWAALLHDVGKVKTRRMEDGKITFIGHPELGARLFQRIERREQLFANEPTLKEKIHFLILHHQRVGQYDGSWTDSAVRRFGKDIGEHLEDLLLLSRADMTTKHRAKRRKNMFAIKELSDRIDALALEDARIPPLPSGIGDELMKALGIPPSRLIGQLKQSLEALVEAGDLPRQAEPEVYLAYVREHRTQLGLPPAV